MLVRQKLLPSRTVTRDFLNLFENSIDIWSLSLLQMSAPYESHGRIMCFHAGCKKTSILLRDKLSNRHFQKSPVAVLVKTTQIFPGTLWP